MASYIDPITHLQKTNIALFEGGQLVGELAGGITITDDGSSDVREFAFREQNTNGVDYTVKLKYQFCRVKPVLDVSTPGYEAAGDAPESLATETNTIHELVGAATPPQLKLEFTCGKAGLFGVGGINDKILNPVDAGKTAIYTLEKLHEGAWVPLVSAGTSEGVYAGVDSSNEWQISPIATLDEDYIQAYILANGYNPNILSKYRLTISARNTVGNWAYPKQHYFFLDIGVEALPLVSWSYNIPRRTVAADTRVEGKSTEQEIDYEQLCNPEYPIVRVKVYDGKDYLAAEGFRGQPAGTWGANYADVFLLKKPDSGSASGNLISPTGFIYDETAGRYFKQFDLTLKSFLDQAGQTLQTVPYAAFRVLPDGDMEKVMRRNFALPANIWNREFIVKVLCRDWVGNEETVVAGVARYESGFMLELSNGSICTPALCPDIQLTSVSVQGSYPNPLVLPDDAPLDVALLPTMRAFSSKYRLQVTDAQTNDPVFPTTGESPDYDTMGAAPLVTLGYGNTYRFRVYARNANGYLTEPEGVFEYTMDRLLLSINKSGKLTGNEEWNWRYRLIGDVIVPSGINLTIKPGATVVVPKPPAVYADKRTKIIIEAGGKLVIDGSGLILSDPDIPDNYMNKDAFIDLVPSGLQKKLENGVLVDYRFSGENNWGGIYFAAGYEGGSKIERARICGAYDGVIVYGAGSGGTPLTIKDSLILSNYIGVHVNGNGRISVSDSVIDSNLEYGIKTEGGGYSAVLDEGVVVTGGHNNKFADYYSGKSRRRLTFQKVKEAGEIKNVEGAN